jgi:hypothetical protein
MLDGPPDLGLASTAETLAAAYQRLVEDLERALWLDESGALTDAYQAYQDACDQALADPQVAERVSVALQELTTALGRAIERPEARALTEEAAEGYLRDVGAAWSDLHAREDSVEALLAVANGMTTLAWLFGLGSSALIAPFGAPASGLGGSWPAAADNVHDDALAAAPAAYTDDDGILWQEFDVGDDGEIVEHTRPAEPPRGAPPSPPRTQAPRSAPHSADAAERVRRAYADYERSVGGRPAATRQGTPERDLLAAYLGLLGGTGSPVDVYATYARMVENAAELMERQLALARGYEQLLEAALQGRRPEEMRRGADERYRDLLATIRDAWAQADPTTMTPQQLADLADTTARAARVHDGGSRPGRES